MNKKFREFLGEAKKVDHDADYGKIVDHALRMSHPKHAAMVRKVAETGKHNAASKDSSHAETHYTLRDRHADIAVALKKHTGGKADHPLHSKIKLHQDAAHHHFQRTNERRDEQPKD